ncbi:PatU [Phormidesmis priestleyi ULC007]|uniref:PatU n=1 Tax=Phormidesmis priestleyi ULC007 TaxID=1920490 RepID=A0A2T1D2A1_9CYAN|nr:hypothetical protein [Phormidesmis priestleyi]PSB14617.1 PatU [Phormidesmis priestleyi ULC007]PZO45652.1 MAG: PatU [Phormidesmis priestleyi]
MDRDSEALQKSYLKLLQELGLTPPDVVDGSDLKIVAAAMQDDLTDPQRLDSEMSFDPDSPFEEDMLLKPGEIPAVQDRFYTLLKNRLQIEIQNKPPLFPWEKEISDYGSETADSEVKQPVFSAASLWMAQLRRLSLPVPLPELVLLDLLEQCQSVLLSPLREGAKLVKAVDSFFPGQSRLLNDVAGYIMVSPARSTAVSLQQLAAEAGAELPSQYEDAIETQQMALSLLAAREIMSALTLTVSPKQPTIERQWLTDRGILTLKTEYQFGQETGRLQIKAELPCGGSLQFQGEQWQALADRKDAGSLSVELRELSLNRTYPLEVRLGEADVMTFAIRPMSAG